MTIYIDTLIFTNIIIDYLLLILTGKILKINYKYFRIIFASVAGGFSSLIILLPNINIVYNLLAKLMFTIGIVFIAFGYKNFKIFLKRIFTLFIISTFFSGIIIFLINIIKIDILAVHNSVVYFNISPVLLILFTTIAYIILHFAEKLKYGKGDLIHKICLQYNNRTYDFLSRYDTCCNVKEPFSGGEVILVEKSLLNNLNVPNSKKRMIPFQSLGGDGIIEGFLPEELYIDDNKISETVYIGLTENIIKGEINSIFNYKNICE